jgi:hypothetical protein
MSPPTLQLREFAKRLILHEAQGRGNSTTKRSTVFPVMEKLRPQLTTLMGRVGFYALLSRACKMAGAEYPWLLKLKIKEDGSFDGLHELESKVKTGQIFEGKIALIAHLFGLLLAFIGEKLTLRLVQEIWPKLPPQKKLV